MKKTLQEIAEETGYSVTTVSRAINGSNWVAPKARSAILSCARKIGYMQGKRTVMLIVPSLSFAAYYRDMLMDLGNILSFSGFKMEMIPLDSLELIEEHNLCGAISIMSDDGLERYWGKQQIMPLVCINTRPRHLDGIFTVASNDSQGMRMITENLIKLGHRRICLLTQADSEKDPNYCHRQRLITFKAVMEEYGISEYMVDSTHWSEDENILVVKKIVDFGTTAIINTCEGDSARTLRILNIMGKRVPEDISLTGWLDTDIDKYCTPPITGIRHNFNYLAKHAFAMFYKLLHKETITDDIIVDYNFIPGNSTAPPPQMSDHAVRNP